MTTSDDSISIRTIIDHRVIAGQGHRRRHVHGGACRNKGKRLPLRWDHRAAFPFKPSAEAPVAPFSDKRQRENVRTRHAGERIIASQSNVKKDTHPDLASLPDERRNGSSMRHVHDVRSRRRQRPSRPKPKKLGAATDDGGRVGQSSRPSLAIKTAPTAITGSGGKHRWLHRSNSFEGRT